MTEPVETGLSGMKEICAYTKRSESIIRKWHRDYGFPLVKLGGAVESDKAKIDAWRRRMIENGGIGAADGQG
jgi:predicted DNA-binding transcriptional regulator AlpA